MDIPKVSVLLLLIYLSSASSNCGSGGVICSTGNCQYPTYIQGCSLYASASACSQCEFNYILSGSICVYAPPTNSSACCKAFLATGDCSQCADGLVLINGQCKDRKIVGCITKSATGSCLNCALDYELIGGVCLKKIPGCSSYSSVGLCQGCGSGYTLTNSLCIPNLSTNQTIPGCQIQYDFGCADCAEGYKLLPDGNCQKGLIEGCERYTTTGSCQACKKPLYSLSNGFCITYGCINLNEYGKCTQCDSSKGFSLGSDGFCQLNNCLVSSLDICLVCTIGFIETSNGCKASSPVKQCTTCAKNYFLNSNGECIPRQPGCITYKGSKCSECEAQYFLNPNSECIIKQIGCIYVNGICSSCALPFKSVNGRCVIQGCSGYTSTSCKVCIAPYILTSQGFCSYPNCNQVSNGKCVSCCDGFAVNHDGFCYQLDPLCKAYDFNGKCIECTLGNYLDNSGNVSVCRTQLFGCNYVDRKCVSCRAPFAYNSTSQTCQIDGCLTYFLGGCQKCDAGYDLRYNYCKLPNCLVSNKGHCAQCDPDYILRSDGACVNKDEFCWKYDEKGFCTECATNYYMSSLNKKCKVREPGCQYDSNDRCYACDSPFYFDGVRCEIYGCLELSTKGCKQCYYPMEVTAGYLCSVVNCDRMNEDKCVACKPGFQIAKDGSCQIEDAKCLVYGAQGCSKCVKGYRIDKNGICQYADEHCWDFSEQGHCTNCDRLYFLNQFNKCQIKDNTCSAYSGGRCITCKSSYYLYAGLCYPNAKGCINQKDIKTCLTCESGYNLNSGVCTPSVTKLTWDSIDMDFWSGSSDKQVQTSKDVFTIGKTNKYNLDGAIVKGKGKIIYSSIIANRSCFQVDDNSDVNGWSPSGSGNQWVGVLLDRLETFYALDIKYLQGNSLTSFAIQQSNDGVTFRRVTQLTVKKMIVGTVQTFYFTPVQSKAIRIVILSDSANIKFEFYYSNGQNQYQNSTSTTWIQQQTGSTILDALKGQQFSSSSSCSDKALCWMGVELCDVGNIKGFTLTPQQGSNGTISTVTVKYSLDGVNFGCFNNCQQINLTGKGSYQFAPYVTATKLRIYPATWTGQPACSITFDY